MVNDTHEIDLHDTTDERRAKKARTPTKRANVVPLSPKKRTPSKSLIKRTATAPAVARESMATPPPIAIFRQQEGNGDDRVGDLNLRINSTDLDTLLPSHTEWKINRNARRSTVSPSENAAAGTVGVSSKPVPWYKLARRRRGAPLSDTDGHADIDNEQTRRGQYHGEAMDLDETVSVTSRRVRASKKRAVPKATTKPPPKKLRSRKQTTTEEEEEEEGEEEEKRNGENWSRRSTKQYEHAWRADREAEVENDGEEGGERDENEGKNEGENQEVEEVIVVAEEEEEEDPPLHRRRKSALKKLQQEIVHAADPIILPGRSTVRRTTRSANTASPTAFNHQHDDDDDDDIQLHTPSRINTAAAASRGRRRKLPIRTVIDPKEWDMTQDVSQASVTSPTKIDEDASETFSPSRNKKRTRTGVVRVNRDELAPITVGVPAGVKEGGTGKQRAKKGTARKAKLKDAKDGTEILTVLPPSQEAIEIEDDEIDVDGTMLPRKKARPEQVDNGCYVIVPSLLLSTQSSAQTASPKARKSNVGRGTIPTLHVPDPDAVVVEIPRHKTSKVARVGENERSLSPTGKGRVKSNGKARAIEIIDEDDDQDTRLIPSTFGENRITSTSTNIAGTAKLGAAPTLTSQQPSGSGSILPPPSSPPQPPHKFATPADTIWSRTRRAFGGSASPSISTPPPPSIAAGTDVSTRKRKSDSYSSASSSSSGGAAASVSTSASVASSQRRWQDGSVIPTTPDRRLTASPHGSINGNRKKWGIKEWRNLEDWYEKEASDIERAAEGFWKENRIIIKGEPGRDDYVGQGQEVELWNR